MRKIAVYNGKYSFAVFESRGKLFISNEHGTRPANKKEIALYRKQLKGD